MTDKQTESRNEAEMVDSAAWEAPEIRRLDTKDAEAASGVGDDSGVFS